MDYKDDFNVFVGGKSGIFKGVKLKQKSCLMKNIQNLISITDDHEITRMNWGDDEEKEILLACGSKEVRSVKTYDTENHTFKTSFICNVGKGSIVGIESYSENILTGIQSGQIKLWKSDKDDYLVHAGENLHCMHKAKLHNNVIGTGGLENPLKLFDIDKKINIFTAKNVSHDWLQLRVPISVNDFCFLSNNNHVVAISKYGHIRLYDVKAQRKPILNLEMKEESLTTISACLQDKQVVCGTGKGRMNLIDLRKIGKILNTYKGPVGAITSIGVSKVDSCVVSTSFDRHLYVHDLNSKALLKKVYLTSKISGMVIRSEFSLKESESEEDTIMENSADIFEDSVEEYSNSDHSEES